MALGRLLIALPALALLAQGRRSPLPPDRASRHSIGLMIVLYGVLWFASYNVALNAASQRIDAGTASMLVNLGPLLVAVLAGVLLKEGFPTPLLTGLAVSFAGVAVIGTSGDAPSGSLLGMALAVLAAAFYASGVLSQKVALRLVDPATATLGGTAVGALVLSPFLPQLVRDLVAAPTSARLWLVYLGVVPTALGFSLWAYALSRAPAGRTASATLAVPALVVAISWIVLDEVPTPRAMVGGTVALLGVMISRR
jgi:drug/metabolite transporter (DMT)-like permease